VSVSNPLVTLGGGSPSLSWDSNPLAGATSFGFEIPQGDPDEIAAAASQMRGQATAFHLAASNVSSGTQVALADWQGAAEAAFGECAGRIVAALRANADALDRGAGAMSRLGEVLSTAQRLCRQAASECETEQRAMITAQGQATQHGQDASTYEQQAANATHPAEQTHLNNLATAARGEQQAAQRTANDASGRLSDWQARGQKAARDYETQATQLATQISDAADEVRTVPEPAGGAPVPITVTRADSQLAMALALAVSRGDEEACENPADAVSREFGPINPATALAFQKDLAQQIRKQEAAAEPQKGNIVDALGGFVSGVVGTHVFGNQDTAVYQNEDEVFSIVSMIPIDPEADAKDVVEVTERGIVEVTEHDGVSAADHVVPFGDQPSPRPAGTQAHHIFQDAAFKGTVPGYTRTEAPSLLMDKDAHLQASLAQRRAIVGGTYGAERQVAIDALIQSGMNPAEARRVVAEAEPYFTKTLGLSEGSPLKIPQRPNLQP
jgi:uncharacterized protein YukE